MSVPCKKFKIAGVPKDFTNYSFGRQIEYLRKVEVFKAAANSVHLSQKRQVAARAINEAIKLYNVKEYYCSFHNSPDCKDDSFEFWYTVK